MAEPKIEWANNGEAFEKDINGTKVMMFAATIDLGDGKPVQKFEGETHKEISDKLLVAQANATKRIRELRGENPPPAPAKAPVEFKRKPLTADEQFEVTQDLQDASKAPAAIKKVIESELGAPIEEVRDRLNADQERDLKEQTQAAIAQFLGETEDYVLCQHNENLMIKYGELNQLAPTDIESYRKIWADLKEAGLAIVKKATDEDAGGGNNTGREPGAQPNGGLPTRQTRPRLASSSTSLRRGDSDDAPGANAKPRYTREEIDKMPSTVYSEKYKSEPGFAQFVDNLR